MKRGEIAIIGLGRMGSSLALNLIDKKIKVIAFNRSSNKTKALAKKGIIATFSYEELVSKFSSKPKIIWLMITSGKAVDDTINPLIPYLKKGDIIIDGGNSYYKDSIKRYNFLKKKGISFLDVGVSGGILGARNGACMMVGGDREIFKKIEPLIKAMCVKDGYGYIGKSGSGHFVKGIHNGIEYGMLASINEGFNAIESKKEFKINVKEVSKIYNNGSIIEGKLMYYLFDFLNKEDINRISCESSFGETEEEMKKLSKEFKMPILKESIKIREKSRKKKTCTKYLSAIRNGFGGHKTLKK